MHHMHNIPNIANSHTARASLPLAALFAAVAFAGGARAQGVPDVMIYEGFLEEGGTPVNGARDFVFELYADAAAASPLWVENETDVPVDNGFFAIALGTTQAGLPQLIEQAGFLQVSVGATVLGRQAIGAVPFSFVAGRVNWDDVTNKPAGFEDGVDDTAAGGNVTAFGSVYLFDEGNTCIFQGPHSSNVTAVTYDAAADACDITFSGFSFSFNSHIAVVSAVGNATAMAVASYGTNNGKLRLHVRRLDGAIYPAGTIVQFMVIVP